MPYPACVSVWEKILALPSNNNQSLPYDVFPIIGEFLDMKPSITPSPDSAGESMYKCCKVLNVLPQRLNKDYKCEYCQNILHENWFYSEEFFEKEGFCNQKCYDTFYLYRKCTGYRRMRPIQQLPNSRRFNFCCVYGCDNPLTLYEKEIFGDLCLDCGLPEY
jgi:hypothetical protein